MSFLEHVREGDWDTVRRNFERLMSLVLDTGGQSAGVRFGSGEATWTANKNSAVVTVPHGLGRTPVYASADSRDVTIDYSVVARDDDSIDVRGFVSDGTAISDTLTFDWIVVG